MKNRELDNKKQQQMESKTAVEKYPIQFREKQFNNDVTKYHNYLLACEDLRILIKNELNIKVDDLEFQSKTEFNNKILVRFHKKHEKENLLKLRPFKLAEILELDLETIHNKYAEVVIAEHKQEPQKEDYTQFVTSPEKIELAKRCQQMIDDMKELQANVPAFTFTFDNNMMSPICHYNGKLQLNHVYFSGMINRL